MPSSSVRFASFNCMSADFDRLEEICEAMHDEGVDASSTSMHMKYTALDFANWAKERGVARAQEMAAFLARNGVDEEHRGQIVEELFSKCDTDQNGYIEIAEFTGQYVDTMD